MTHNTGDPPASLEPEGPRSHTRYFVLFGLCSAATIAYLCRNSIAVAESTIRAETGISEKDMGLIMSLFFLVYALGQIPTGWFADRVGSRFALPLFSLLWSAATAGFTFFSSAIALMISRALNGLGQAGLFPGSTNTISKWFPNTERAFASGSLSSFMSVGGAIATLLTGLLLPILGWRTTFLVYALPGVLWAVLFYVLFRNRPHEHPRVSPVELRTITDGQTPEQLAVSPQKNTPWTALLTSPAMWWINAQQFFRAAGFMFFGSWFPTYLQQTRGVSVTKSAVLTVLPQLAVVFGSPLGGMLSDYVMRRTGSRVYGRQYVASGCLFVCAALISSAYFVADPYLAVAIITLGTFWFALGGPCSYAIAMDMGGLHVATVFAMMNMSGNIGAALFPYVVPHFKEWTGSWDAVLWLFAGLFVGASLSWLMLDTKGTVFDQAIIPETPAEETP